MLRGHQSHQGLRVRLQQTAGPQGRGHEHQAGRDGGLSWAHPALGKSTLTQHHRRTSSGRRRLHHVLGDRTIRAQRSRRDVVDVRTGTQSAGFSKISTCLTTSRRLTTSQWLSSSRGCLHHEAEQAAVSRIGPRWGWATVCITYPDQLSGGQQQRVAIARAIAGNRPVAPWRTSQQATSTSQAAKRCLQLFKELCHDEDNPISILMVTHDP